MSIERRQKKQAVHDALANNAAIEAAAMTNHQTGGDSHAADSLLSASSSPKHTSKKTPVVSNSALGKVAVQ